MTRKYNLVVIKDDKEIIVDETPNHASQMLSEYHWDTRHIRGPLRGCDFTKEEWERLQHGILKGASPWLIR